MIKLKPILAAIIVSGGTTFHAHASEYESAWQDTEQCYIQYEQTLLALPEVATTPLTKLLQAYDRHADETRCTVMFGFSEGHLESIGYFGIIEYRDDLHRRKERYSAILDIFSDWTAEAKAKRPDFSAALQARIDAAEKSYDLHEARMKWINRNSQKSGATQ